MISCGQDEIYQPIESTTLFSVDLSKVPYSKLSDYQFFKNDIKDQIPVDDILPFAPASGLFSNYAKKKRFIWMPKNTKANFIAADKSFDFPNGTVLIKTFYYENVLPNNTTQNIETRLLINNNGIWKAYNYIWNDLQTEAFLDTNQQGSSLNISWLENGISKTVDYKIPSQTECITCHKINVSNTNESLSPIGTKPQNLNFIYQYANKSNNQLLEWKSRGFLGNDTPTNLVSVVNWEDASQSLELRARSYLDANCAHCHRENGYCDYAPQRFNFSNTNLLNLGVCLPSNNQQFGKYIFQAGNATKSAAINRMNSNLGSVKMPIIGRNTVHTEGVQLISNWINSLQNTCN